MRMAGTLRALVGNMVAGVSKGFRAQAGTAGRGLSRLGAGQHGSTCSSDSPTRCEYKLPKGIKAETPSQTEIVVRGVDKQLVGQVAAEIRAFRPPEPYKGKGVRYANERVRAQGSEEEVAGGFSHDERQEAAGCVARAQPDEDAGTGRYRLSVHRTPRHIYAQVISPDGTGCWPARRRSTRIAARPASTGNTEAAAKVGALIAERAKAAGVSQVAFDRSGFKYHGRIKALADAAREGGLEF